MPLDEDIRPDHRSVDSAKPADAQATTTLREIAGPISIIGVPVEQRVSQIVGSDADRDWANK